MVILDLYGMTFDAMGVFGLAFHLFSLRISELRSFQIGGTEFGGFPGLKKMK